jgi:hypothetical protein
MQQCHREFREPEERAKAVAAEAAAEKLAADWASVAGTLRDAPAFSRAFGEPTLRTTPRPCSPRNGQTPPPMCVTLEWSDGRKAKASVCAPGACAFKAEFIAASAGFGDTWAWWPDSF